MKQEITLQERFQLNLQRIMKAQNMTQKELAQLTGLTQMTINSWICGRFSPGLDALEKVCSALGTTPKEMLSIDFKTKTPTDGEAVEIPIADFIICTPQNNVHIKYSKDTLLLSNRDYRNTSPENLKVLRLYEDKLYPYFQPEDMLLIDTSAKYTSGDTVLIFTAEKQTEIREIILSEDYIKFRPYDSNEETISIPKDSADVTVYGKVIKLYRDM